MMTTSDANGLRTPNTALGNTPKIDSYAGALALIDILFDMKAINKATYEKIIRNSKSDLNRKVC